MGNFLGLIFIQPVSDPDGLEIVRATATKIQDDRIPHLNNLILGGKRFSPQPWAFANVPGLLFEALETSFLFDLL